MRIDLNSHDVKVLRNILEYIDEDNRDRAPCVQYEEENELCRKLLAKMETPATRLERECRVNNEALEFTVVTLSSHDGFKPNMSFHSGNCYEEYKDCKNAKIRCYQFGRGKKVFRPATPEELETIMMEWESVVNDCFEHPYLQKEVGE